MKRLFLVVFIICAVFYGNAFARPAFGVKAGLNLANANEGNDPYEASNKIKLAFLLGGTAEFSLSQSNTTTIRLELLYAQKGWKESGEFVYGGFLWDYEGSSSIDELVVAPFLVMRFPSGNVTPFIQGGPELGLNLGATWEEDYNGSSESGDWDDWSSMNFGFNIGGGMALPTGKGEVIFDARYNFGLMNLYTGSGDYSVKTNGIQLCVGYNFTVPTKGK
ncbi:PorT family protein [bacterium]|nr:PorT family protein [bacterium]MBU1936287.1 PorT family protein [bacterium]